MRRVAGLCLAATLAAACGTGSVDLDVEEPTATLFPEADDTETTDSVATTTAAPNALAGLDPTDLPMPRSDAPGVVVLDGIAAPVETIAGGTWTVSTPCGSVRDGTQPSPVTALVALDPAGDAGTGSGAAELARNAAIVDAVRARLAEAGIEAITTRPRDADIPAGYRGRAAAATGARIVVSVAVVDGVAELGASPSLEVVHPAADTDARRLAGLLFAAVEPVVDQVSVGWPTDVEPGVRAVLNQRGDDYFTILREPAEASRVVLHLPVDPDAVLFADDDSVGRLAEAVAEAIVQHLVSDREGSGFVAPPEVVRDAPIADPATCVDPLVITEDG